MWHAWCYGSWGGWGLWIPMILFWLVPPLLAVGLFWVILRRSGGRANRAADGPSAEDNRRALAILKERYARGEISRDEFEHVKNEILSS